MSTIDQMTSSVLTQYAALDLLVLYPPNGFVSISTSIYMSAMITAWPTMVGGDFKEILRMQIKHTEQCGKVKFMLRE